MAHQQTYDVIIIGGGMAGMTTALVLAREGFSVACLDRVGFDAQTAKGFDNRTIAISAGSAGVLKKAGVWDTLAPMECAINDIDVRDGESPVLLRFESREAGEPFGWIFENRDVRRVLFEAAQEIPDLTIKAPVMVKDIHYGEKDVTVTMDDGAVLSASLLIGADGRGSFVRQTCGIDTKTTNYHQKALVCTVWHEKPHHGLALERFDPQGPFALLPMTDDADGRHRSALVWTREAEDRARLDTVSKELFHLALSEKMDARYGAVLDTGARRLFPLSLVHAKKYTAPRTVLIADAAHAIHPIAGQGLNLGMRDIDVLTDLMAVTRHDGGDIGSAAMLQSYETARRADNDMMIAATDALNRIFQVRFPPFKLARKAGIRAVHRLPPLKKHLMRYAMGKATRR